MSNVRFLITSTGFNCDPWPCIMSVARQGYEGKVQHAYVAADALTYGQAIHAQHVLCGDRLDVDYSPAFTVENVFNVWSQSTLPPDTVVVWLDGDDQFTHAGVLEILADVYSQPDAPWITYGDYRYGAQLPPYGKQAYFGTRYDPSRGETPRGSRWRVSHPKTFRLGLAQRVKREDLLHLDGTFIRTCSDRAFMIPMLEMAGARYQTLRDVLVQYNYHTSFEVNATDEEKAGEALDRQRIHSLPPYSLLADQPW